MDQKSLQKRPGIWLVLAILACVSPAYAMTIHVPADAPTIQAGVDKANNGDVVVLADNTYSGQGNVDIHFGGKSITVRSENGPTGCIIDGEHAARGFIFDSGETSDARLESVTITNGFSDQSGGGIEIDA